MIAGAIGSLATVPVARVPSLLGANVGNTIEGVQEIAKGLFSMFMGGVTVIESEGLLYWAGVTEIALGEKEILSGISTLTTDPTPGVNYLPDPNAATTITLPTVEITGGAPGPTVITTSEIIIYGTPPAGVTPANIITLPPIEITNIPDQPPGGESESESEAEAEAEGDR